MRFFFSDTFDLPLPAGHRFPGHKYGMLRRSLLAEGLVTADMLMPSPAVAAQDLARAHDAGYIDGFLQGTLEHKAMRRIGLPWSEHLVRRTRRTMGGAVAAAASALQTGLSGQLAGGTHHAHRGFGAGYCVFNDFAVVALKALDEGWVERVAIVDLDVHQGDGNAAILAADPRVFVLSIHCESNFPFDKIRSDLDVALPEGTGDDVYLRTLDAVLPAVLDFRPGLVLYQAGVDPLRQDRLGKMDLTFAGLARRDSLVLSRCARAGTPVSMAIGGGYAEPITATVAAYANTYRAAKEVYGF